jgi:archaellin
MGIKSSPPETGMQLKAQGATEYLVLLAVVLIVALVSVALLGFFLGMASDAQETQSKAYWSSASPISIVEWGARTGNTSGTERTISFMRIRNTGAYPITITKILADGYSMTEVCTGSYAPSANISDIYRLAPGEEMEIGRSPYFTPDPGSGNRRFFGFSYLGGSKSVTSCLFNNIAASYCARTQPYGTLVVNNFGFEYTVTIDGQTITKKQIGAKPLAIKCTNSPYDW